MASKDSNDDEVNDKPDNAEDNFGLPDIEYKPLDQGGESNKTQEEVTSGSSGGNAYASADSDSDKSSDSYDAMTMEESKSKAPVILGIVIVLVLIIAGYLIYNFVYKPSQAEKAKQEQLAKEALEKKKRDEAARLAKQREEEERRKQEELANAKPPVGMIETLSGRTKRYYVVVTSDIDDDLLMDYAKKLSAKGVNTKVIPPFGGKKYYRLAIADHETFAAAQANADAAKADYGSAVWVIKY